MTSTQTHTYLYIKHFGLCIFARKHVNLRVWDQTFLFFLMAFSCFTGLRHTNSCTLCTIFVCTVNIYVWYDDDDDDDGEPVGFVSVFSVKWRYIFSEWHQRLTCHWEVVTEQKGVFCTVNQCLIRWTFTINFTHPPCLCFVPPAVE